MRASQALAAKQPADSLGAAARQRRPDGRRAALEWAGLDPDGCFERGQAPARSSGSQAAPAATATNGSGAARSDGSGGGPGPRGGSSGGSGGLEWLRRRA